MRRIFTCFTLILLFYFNTAAQSDYCSVAPIIARKCAGCHNGKKEVPFDFYNNAFDAVKRNATLIKHVINTGYMPPWLADTTYRHFKNERVLTKGEKKLITDWIDDGLKPCNAKEKSDDAAPKTIKAKADTSFYIKDEIIQLGEDEKYVTYRFKLYGKKGKYVNRITFKPGPNAKTMHHCNIFITDANKSQENIVLAIGWTRGNSLPEFPKNTGFTIDSFVNVEIEVHYTNVPATTTIGATIDVYCKEGKPERNFEMLDCGGIEKVGMGTLIPADTVITYHVKHSLEKTISVFSVYPHMHLFGKSMHAYAINPKGDTIPLIRINKWVFDWQEQYVLSKPLVLEKGTEVHMYYTYDNTKDNPANPNVPPKAIPFSGMKSYEEMLNLFLHYVDYKEGDLLMDNWY